LTFFGENKKMKRINILIVLGFILLNVTLCLGELQKKKIWERNSLTGDWNGLRSKLKNNGFNLEVIYTGEISSIRKGGLQKKTVFLDNKDIVLFLDANKLLGWKHTEFCLYFLGNAGESPTKYIGDIQAVSSIDAFPTWKLYEAWYQGSFFNNKLSLKFGLYDLNSEFDVMDSCSIFHNGAFGMGVDISQSGLNGPSIFPVTSLGLRAKYIFQCNDSKNYYSQLAILDGVPGNLDNPAGTHIILKSSDGLLLVNETGYVSTNKYYKKFAIGIWYYTANTSEILPNSNTKYRKNKGAYLLAEHQIFQEKNTESQGLIAFLRIGTADKYVNQLDFYMRFGLNYTGIIPGRDNDQLAIGLTYAHNSKNYIKVNKYNLTYAETVIEIVYRFQITPWFAIKPDLQYVINPGTSKQIKNALVFGFRTEMIF
jgi:porin